MNRPGTMKQGQVGKMTFAFSALLHAWVFSGQASATAMRSEPPRPQTVEFVVTEPEPPAPEPEAEPVPVEPKVEPLPQAALVDPAPTEAEPAPNVAEEPEVELTGATLLSESDASFSAATGSGRARRGAFRSGVSRAVVSNPKPKAPLQKHPVQAPAPAFVPLADLGRLPKPPDLARDLMRNYPSGARAQGKSGEAKVRARIEPTGKVEQAQVTFETADGFGSACRQTLLGSRWSPPRDKNGNRVTTWVNYRCRFRIDG